MNEVTLGDKIYISSKRAAEITGYAKDYVGQLCREGHIDAKMIGRGWYVYEPSIRAHRFGPESIAVSEPEPEEVIEETEPEIVSSEDVSAPLAWQNPVYTSEAPQMLPEIAAPVALEELLPPAEESLTDMQTAWKEWFDRKQEILHTPEIESPEVIDARKEEYVEQNEIEEQGEEYEVEEDDNDEDASDESLEEVSVPLHRIEEAYKAETEPEEEAEIIPIRTIQAPVPQYIPAPTPVRAVYAEPVRTYEAPVAPAPEAKIVTERVLTKREAASKRSKQAKRSTGSNAPMVALLVGLSIVTISITVIGSGLAEKYVQTFTAHNAVIDFLTGTREFKR